MEVSFLQLDFLPRPPFDVISVKFLGFVLLKIFVLDLFRGWLAGSGKDVEENYAKMTNLSTSLFYIVL